MALVALLCASLGMVFAGAYFAAGSARAAVDSAPRSPILSPATPTEQGDGHALTALLPLAPPAAAPPPAPPIHVDETVASSRDLDCLSTAIYYEARGETTAGQAAVAQVVLNRARHPAFPKTVCGVVYQGAAPRSCQFSFVCNGAMRRPREPGAWARAKSVAARALGGYVMAEVGEATCFHAARIGAGRGAGVGRITRIGGQVFYGAGRGGAARLWRHHEYAVDAHATAIYASATLVADTGSVGAVLRPAVPTAAGQAVDSVARQPAATSLGS